MIGERIVPFDAGRIPSSSFGAGVDDAVAMGQYRKDRVFIFDSEGLPAEAHLDRWTFTPRQVARIYEVEPIGGIEPDPNRTALPTRRCCPGAVVLRRVWPVMTSEEKLNQRMTALLRSAKFGHSPIPVIDHGLSCYVPALPGWIYFLDTLDEHETLLAKVHELTHASFHPPGAEDYDEANYLDVEERSAHEVGSEGLRSIQTVAIDALEDSLRSNRPRALAQMATGSGKTFMAANEAYRLIKFSVRSGCPFSGSWRMNIVGKRNQNLIVHRRCSNDRRR